jgi:hypothetical protein
MHSAMGMPWVCGRRRAPLRSSYQALYLHLTYSVDLHKVIKHMHANICGPKQREMLHESLL